MIKIRLARGGARNHPMYRIVAIEESRKGNGKHLEILGYYDPEKKNCKIDKNRYQKWLSFGAKATPTVKKLIDNK